jgi:hypothetical protein
MLDNDGLTSEMMRYLIWRCGNDGDIAFASIGKYSTSIVVDIVN